MLLRVLRIALITVPLAPMCVVLMGITCVIVSLFESKGSVQHRVAAFWGRALLAVSGVKVRVAGLENVPREGGFVFVSNHVSHMDVPVIYGHLPVPFRFIAKKSLFRVPFLGWHLHRGGHIQIVREDTRSSVRALAEARRLLGEGRSVHVFAEGSRSVGPLRAFKAGAALIAIKAGATVIPIGVAGTEAVLPRGAIFIRPGTVGLRVGEPIPTAGLASRDHAAFTEQLRERVSALIAEGGQAAS